jgi:hypothetical protein
MAGPRPRDGLLGPESDRRADLTGGNYGSQ